MPPFDAITRASQTASLDRSSERTTAAMTRHGRTTGQSVSSALDRRTGASQTPPSGPAHTPHGLGLSAQYPRRRVMLPSATPPAAVRALVGVSIARSRRLGRKAARLGANMQRMINRCGRSVVRKAALRWEGEERKTVGEMQSLDELRKGLSATLGGWRWEPRVV